MATCCCTFAQTGEKQKLHGFSLSTTASMPFNLRVNRKADRTTPFLRQPTYWQAGVGGNYFASYRHSETTRFRIGVGYKTYGERSGPLPDATQKRIENQALLEHSKLTFHSVEIPVTLKRTIAGPFYALGGLSLNLTLRGSVQESYVYDNGWIETYYNKTTHRKLKKLGGSINTGFGFDLFRKMRVSSFIQLDGSLQLNSFEIDYATKRKYFTLGLTGGIVF